MKKLICLLILTQSLFAFAQQDKVYKMKDIAILHSDSLLPGFYLNYNDFTNNKPSKQGVVFNEDLRFYKKDGTFWNKKKQKLYTYKNPKKKERIKYNRVKVKMWGYNDGKSIFVYYHKRYNKMNEMGRYCIFTYELHKIYSGHNNSIYPYVHDVERDYVLDIFTGDIYKLNARNIKKYLLVDDPKLMEEFKHESMRKTMYYYYVNEVNKKYLD